MKHPIAVPAKSSRKINSHGSDPAGKSATPARKKHAAPSSAPLPLAAVPGERTVLLAVTGQSPAILTETVWRLAHEQPRCIPHEVVVITTTVGRTFFERELLAPSPQFGGIACWDALRAALADEFPEARERLILDNFKVLTAPDPASGRVRQLDDIRTRADNDAAANFILREVRSIVTNPDCRLVASIAGGRKTMVALLYGCMSLLGRGQDQLTHVLVNQPFDEPGLTPRFYFPTTKPATHELKDRAGNVISRHSSADARIELCSVPFVCLRTLFLKELRRPAGDFIALVNRYDDQIAQLAGPPLVRIDTERCAILVNDVPAIVTTRELGLFAFLVDRCQRKQPAYARVIDTVADLRAFLSEWMKSLPEFSNMRGEAQNWLRETDDDFPGEINRQKSKLDRHFTDAGLGASLDFLLPKKKAFGINVRLAD